MTRGWTPVPLDAQPRSPSERALLERLAERRTEIEARAREVEFRENLLKAAEKRLEGRLAELKDLEARVNTAVQQKDEAEVSRFKNLVMMYENMKAKDAAKIFDRLDLKILVEVSTQINPRAGRSLSGPDLITVGRCHSSNLTVRTSGPRLFSTPPRTKWKRGRNPVCRNPAVIRGSLNVPMSTRLNQAPASAISRARRTAS